MSRSDTAVLVISASPGRVFAALTGSDALAVWLPTATERNFVEPADGFEPTASCLQIRSSPFAAVRPEPFLYSK